MLGAVLHRAPARALQAPRRRGDTVARMAIEWSRHDLVPRPDARETSDFDESLAIVGRHGAGLLFLHGPRLRLVSGHDGRRSEDGRFGPHPDSRHLVTARRTIPWMRIDKPGSIVSVFAYRPLEFAVETATINLIDWLVRDHGYSATDAYCLVSTCPDFRINVYQMCRVRGLSYVAGAELPKRYLPGSTA